MLRVFILLLLIIIDTGLFIFDELYVLYVGTWEPSLLLI